MWPELYEGATFEQKVFSNICLYSDRLYKTTWHCLKFHKSIFMNRSNEEPHDKAFTLILGSCSTRAPWVCSLQELEPAWPDSRIGVYIKLSSEWVSPTQCQTGSPPDFKKQVCWESLLVSPGFGFMFKAKRLRCERGLTSPTVMLM